MHSKQVWIITVTILCFVGVWAIYHFMNTKMKKIDLSYRVERPGVRANLKTNRSAEVMRCNVYNMRQKNNDNFDCVPFHPTKQMTTPICIYDVKKDIYISKSIKNGGVWEAVHLHNINNIFKKDPHLGLIDIGANIGTWTLAAAKMGRFVVAVEPSLQNVRRLHKAAQLGNLLDKITLIHNAISNVYTKIRLRESGTNQGVKEVVSDKNKCPTCTSETVGTIFMDDILEVLPFRRAILKVDVEGHEMQAFSKSSKLFEKIFIPYIMVEWQWYAMYWTRDAGKISKVENFIKFFIGKNYYPYDPAKNKLDPKKWTSWPNDIYWRYELSY